jgi:hypothetical protein
LSDALSVAEVEITPIVAIALAASLLNAGIAVGSTAVVGAGVRGEGLNRLSYAGRWDFVYGNFDGRLDGQSARSFHPDDDVTLFFNGRRLRIFGITGTASVSLGDGSAEQTISLLCGQKARARADLFERSDDAGQRLARFVVLPSSAPRRT